MYPYWDERRDFYRGEIYFADLDPRFGHEQGGFRPVLILQNDRGNLYSPNVIVSALTRRTGKKPNLPTHVLVDGVEGLDPSMCLLECIDTLDKRRLGKYVGRLSEEQMKLVDAALRVSLYLDEDACLPTEVEAP